MIRAIVFDLDDTLILEYDYIISGYKEVSIKLEVDTGINRNSIFKNLVELFKISPKNVFNRFLDNIDFNYSEEYIKELIDLYRNHDPDIKLLDESKYILDALKDKGYKLGVITDGYKETQRKKINKIDSSYFESIVVTDEIGREYWKPHEKPFLKAIEELKIDFCEMIYVGDNVSKDFVKANELGITTIGVKRETGIYRNITITDNYLPKYWIKSLYDLLELIEKIDQK